MFEQGKDHMPEENGIEKPFKSSVFLSGLSLIAQLVKNLLVMQETLVRFLGRSLEKG